MSHEIPEPYVWDESFRVFYGQLDEEHKGLFQAIFNLAKSPNDANVLNTLRNLIKAHFAYEEGQLKDANYPEFSIHKSLHDSFVEQLADVTSVGQKELHWAKNWLVNHIKNTDFKYKGKLH